MMIKELRDKLEHLAQVWRARQKACHEIYLDEQSGGIGMRNHYEGISLGYRWCCEDLEALIKNHLTE